MPEGPYIPEYCFLEQFSLEPLLQSLFLLVKIPNNALP